MVKYLDREIDEDENAIELSLTRTETTSNFLKSSPNASDTNISEGQREVKSEFIRKSGTSSTHFNVIRRYMAKVRNKNERVKEQESLLTDSNRFVSLDAELIDQCTLIETQVRKFTSNGST